MSNSNKKPRAAVYLRKSGIDDHSGRKPSFARQATGISKIISKFEVIVEVRERVGPSVSHHFIHDRVEWD